MTLRRKRADTTFKHAPVLLIFLIFAGCGGNGMIEDQPVIGAVTEFAISGQTLYAVSPGAGAIFRLEHGENSWTIMNISRVRSLTVAEKTLYAGKMNGRIFRLAEGDNLWTELPLLPHRKGGHPIRPLVASGKTLYAGYEFAKGLYRLDDEGDSWKQIDGGWENDHVVFLEVSGRALYVSTVWGHTFVSKDRGNSWMPISAEVSLLRVVSEDILYGKTSAEGIVYSKTGGKEWIPIGLKNRPVFSLILSGTTLYAGTNDGIFRLDNDGKEWIQTGLEGSIVLSLAVLGTTLYAGTTFDGVFRSEDNGHSWTPFNNHIRKFPVHPE